MLRNILLWLATIALLGIAASPLLAQETRATLVGAVTDASGATVPNAQITVTGVGTGVVTKATTSESGSFMVPFLVPGDYQVTVASPGFKTFEQTSVQLRVADRTRLDIKLEVGAASERITVTAQTPLLETESADRGQVIERLNQLPIKSNNPLNLIAYAAGVNYQGGNFYWRPFDQSVIDNFSVNGGRTFTNEFQLDGSPNLQGGGVAYVPPVEAVQEFKVMTNTYDAQFGHNGGGVFNTSIKGGANKFHGVGYEYMRRTALNANTFQNNANRSPMTNQPVDQYGGQISGPVRIPKIYNGQNKTFFMFAMEHYKDSNPQAVYSTVPTALEKQGDFSKTMANATTQYVIYDPLTVALNPSYDPGKATNTGNLQYIRQVFAGNKIPQSRFNPVAVNVLKYFPDPQSGVGDQITGVNNFFGADAAELNFFNNDVARVDHTINDRWKMYGRWMFSKREVTRPMGTNAWHMDADGATDAFRRNDGGTLAFTGTLSPSTVLDLHASIGSYSTPCYAAIFDQKTLGFPASLLSQIRDNNMFPQVNIANYNGSRGEFGQLKTVFLTYTLEGSVLKTIGSHTLKFGAETRLYQQSNVPGGYAPRGQYSFDRGFTSASPNVTVGNTGNGVASLLLGDMSGGSVLLPASEYRSQKYVAIYFQDTWQATPRLNLNFGARWDMEGPMSERFNRLALLDLTSPFPAQVPGYNLIGGYKYAGVNGTPVSSYNFDKNNWQPRFGLAYKVPGSKSLVFRGGIGRSFLPQYMIGVNTTGFSSTTTTQTATADYLPFQTFSNPFPNGLIPATGSSLGLLTNAGNGISANDPSMKVPYVWSYSAGFQYQLTQTLLVEGTYVGSQNVELGVNRQLQYLTLDQLAKGTASLNTVVSNPFYKVLDPSSNRGASATTQLRNTIVPYPQFNGVTVNNQSIGGSWYNSAQFRVEKRFSKGFWFLANYTISKAMETTGRKNNQDSGLSRELSSFDIPQRLTLSGIYQFPVGPGRKWLSHGFLSKVVGGWEFDWNGVIQSGQPIGLNSGWFLSASPQLPNGQQNYAHWFNTDKSAATGIWYQRAADTLNVMPARSPNIRNPSVPQMDFTLVREFRISESHRFQFKAAAYNATNTPFFGGPNTDPTSTQFGIVTLSQNNVARNIELTFRYSF